MSPSERMYLFANMVNEQITLALADYLKAD